MIRRRALLLGGGLLPLAACASGGELPPATVSVADDGYHGTAVTNGHELPDVTLTDQDGRPYPLRTGASTPVVILFFGYTNCPDVCPGILADMAVARRRLPQELAEQVTLMMISTDPARDTPEVLKDYLRRIDESYVGLTGDLAEITRVADSLGVAIEEGRKLPSGGYEVDHGSQVMGIGKDRRVQVLWTDADPGQLREDYARLVASQG